RSPLRAARRRHDRSPLRPRPSGLGHRSTSTLSTGYGAHRHIGTGTSARNSLRCGCPTVRARGEPMSLREDATAMRDELAALRRDLHQIPEIGLHLPKTQERVLAALAPLPLEVTTGKGL